MNTHDDCIEAKISITVNTMGRQRRKRVAQVHPGKRPEKKKCEQQVLGTAEESGGGSKLNVDKWSATFKKQFVNQFSRAIQYQFHNITSQQLTCCIKRSQSCPEQMPCCL